MTFASRTSAAPFVALRESHLKKSSVLPLFVLFALANIAVSRWEQSIRAEQERNLLHAADALALPVATARYDRSAGQDPARYWPAIPDARQQRLVVLTGMSQMYAINEQRDGDQTISEWLDDHYAPTGVRVFGLAAPNLANEEALFLLIAELASTATHPSVLIFGVNFDKFRNIDLRGGYLGLLRAHPEMQAQWRAVATRYAAQYPAATAKMLSTLSSLAADSARKNSSLERRLRDGVGKWVPVVRNRQALNGYLLSKLYTVRNAALGITTSSKRPIIRARFEMNREFLEMMVAVARENGTRVGLYVTPLNPLAVNPYVPNQYEAFKRWLQEYAHKHAIPFANLEHEIPAEDWGRFMDGPDFMHFKGEGHRLTALAIERHFDVLIRGTGKRCAQLTQAK